MKGFKTLVSVIIVGSTALVAVIAYLIHRPEKAAPVEVVIDTPDGLNVDMDTAYLECSHHSKEWQLCTQPEGRGTFQYCSAYSEYNESDLALVEEGDIGVPTPYSPCFTCPAAGISCEDHVKEVFTAAGISEDQNATLAEWLNLWDDGIVYCEFMCESKKEGESCSQDWDNDCMPGELFCDYKDDSTVSINGTGTCKPCPTDTRDCYKDGFVSSKQGKNNCLECQMMCYSVCASKVWVEGVAIPSQPIMNAIQSSHQSATGTLHDCSNLSLESASSCPGAKGKMCLVYFENTTANDDDATSLNAEPWQVSDNAEDSGCVGVIAFDQAYYEPPLHTNSELLIPYVYIAEEEGLVLLGSKIGMDAKVEVDIFGAICDLYSNQYGDGEACNTDLPCDDDSFCAFDFGGIGPDLYSEGWCLPCPEDPTDCYFDAVVLIEYDDIYASGNYSYPDTVQNVESCAKACDAGAALASKECKFCPTKLTEFSFGVDDEEDRCQFCPQNDVQYPDRRVPLFGDNITCSQMVSFFERLPVPKSSDNCLLAQSTNYICGCEGRGYAGANTSTKKVVLAWLPRTAAILSMLGSLFIIVDTQRTPQKRAKLINKILCATSVFDVMGSFAMSFTTLPTQQEDYIYGSQGNDQTCKAQGFFIQMGTIACLLGVSLALYYYFTIKQGWNEARMKRNHILHYLLATPIAIGLAFACAGIPFYDNVLVWCNNSAKWWPEIPIVLALFHVTAIMVDVLYTVHQQEKATSRFTGGSRRLSKMVFHQAIYFVGAFYITWIPYLVLQYMLSSGKGYDEYGLTLAASTMCALQGFWNFIVYARPRNYLTRSSMNSLSKSFKMRMSSGTGKDNNGTTQAATATPNHSEANKSASKSGMAASPLFADESEFVPFQAPEAGEVDECEVGAATAPQDSSPLVAETELEPLEILEVEAEADELATGESAGNQNRNDECNSTSPFEDPSAVNEPEHTHSRFRATLMNLRSRFARTNSEEDQLTFAGDGLDPAIIRQHNEDDDGDETIDIDAMFEMLLAG